MRIDLGILGTSGWLAGFLVLDMGSTRPLDCPSDTSLKQLQYSFCPPLCSGLAPSPFYLYLTRLAIYLLADTLLGTVLFSTEGGGLVTLLPVSLQSCSWSAT